MKSTPTTETKKRIYVPADFGDVIEKIPDECPLIGGQAVAWWAQQYCPAIKPVTSCDIDFWGFKENLMELARALGQKPILPTRHEMTIWVGAIQMRLKGETTVVDFINTVPGLDSFNAEKVSVRQWFGAASRQKEILVLSPVSLVLAKIYALKAFDQSGRQDERHLKVSLVTAKSFIEQLLREGKIKHVLWNIERLIAASQNKPYRRLEAQHDFQIVSAIPIKQIQESACRESLPKSDRDRLQNFLKLRWPQTVKQTAQGTSPIE